ncbi:MetQ/NlpA family ABC transporter substrate-binding protein [Clostridium intestinale]|uniref:MetQ/NlpA family ABC transporter substrate-binding protein n=1 Tax=Clostridium intestinale TaxID=36845 RepID=UPI0028E2D273|nr:MetQ/NlpA family ABC transporter substrate-binding protein [Clostridium intestinale]
MKRKGLLSILLVGALAFSLTGCGKKDDKTIKIGVTPVPHEEIVNEIKPLVEAKGYKLEIIEFNDYVTPNTALAEKELDANFFQHVPYLEETNKEKGLDLTWVAKIHIEPMGLYSKKVTKFADIKDGANIAIPNDASNGSRALKLLADNGLFKVKDAELISPADITENPKNIKITELDAAQLPRTLDDAKVDAAVINTNYALDAGLNPLKDALVIESKDSPYANVLAVRKGDEETEKTKILKEALTSSDVKTFIEKKYDGSIVPAF